MGKLEGKVAIVTGGGSGIGRAFVHGLSDEGAKVAIAELNSQWADAVAKELHEKGREVLSVSMDVSDEANTLATARTVVDRYGQIDILVNNAALFSDLKRNNWLEIPVEEWDRVMAVNVRGVWLCCRAVAPYMIKKGKGKIVNMASNVVFGVPGLGLLHYTASKGAVLSLTRGLARDLGEHGINVNAIGPGLTVTEKTKMDQEQAKKKIQGRSLKRLGVPSDLVGTLIYLASGDSDLLTGQMIMVEGGATMQ